MQRLAELLSFDGRLSRIGYWRAYLLLTITTALVWCAGLFAILLIGPLGAVILAPMPPLLIGIVAIAVRRLHDRGRSGWWVLPLVVFPLAVSLGLAAQVPGANPPAIDLLLSLAGFILSLWGWVEIGFRRGASGPNRFGEDPVAAV